MLKWGCLFLRACLLLLCISGLIVAAEQNSDGIETYLKQGNIHFQDQEYEKAVEQYKAAVAAYPDSARGYFYLGDAYWQLDQQQDAIDSYQKAIEVDYKFKSPYYSLARCYLSLKSYEAALKTYGKLAAILDSNVDVFNLIADVYYLAGNYEGCILTAEKIIDAESSYFSAYLHIGLSYLALEDTSQAREWLKKAKKVSKKHYNVPPCPSSILLRHLVVKAQSDQTLENILESIVELPKEDFEVFVTKNPTPGLSKLKEKPVEIHRVNPEYPKPALRSGIQGTVVVKALIGTTGRILRAEIMKGDRNLNEEALKAAYQFKFKPGKINGRAVLVWVSIPFYFRLK